MAQQLINIGQAPNDKSGDLLRTAFTKINDNFTELYSTPPATTIDRLVNGDAELVLNVNGVTPYVEFPADEGANIILQGPEVIAFGSTMGVGSFGSNVLITANAQGPSQQWTFNVDGNVACPGDITQSHQDNTNCPPSVSTVVYTSTGQYRHAIKLFVMAEGLTDGGGTSWDTQACDIIAVKGYNNNIVHVTTYGVTYSGSSAIATFDGRWNATTNRIEITCQPVSLTNSVTLSVHAIELNSND